MALVTETFKTDRETYEILHDTELLKPFNGAKSRLIKESLKHYALNVKNVEKKTVDKAEVPATPQKEAIPIGRVRR